MATQVHVAKFKLTTLDGLGNVIDKNNPATQLNKLKDSSTEPRIMPDPAIPNTNGSPTLEAYLAAEVGNGFVLQHLDQTYCITYK